MKNKYPKIFIIDVDGVMTDGKFYYSEKGKVLKCFGPDDNDALKLLKGFMDIQFVTGDKRGFVITKKRISDMKFNVQLVSTIQRLEWIKNRFNLNDVIYMGYGIFYHYIMKEVKYSIAPANADKNCKQYANFVTRRHGGDRAVSEACLHILKKFFIPYSEKKNLQKNIIFSGGWNS
jgi:3-deoxy-D-manno-octulosonate 8-phosphate phosphatase (KDO 8-P phosphatase)